MALFVPEACCRRRVKPSLRLCMRSVLWHAALIPRHTIRRRCCPCCCHRDMSCCRRRNPRFLHFPAHSTANRPPTDKYPSACRAEARA